MNLPEDIKLYMPKFLPHDKQEELMQELSKFPENIDKRFYSTLEENIVLQGDGLKDLLVVNLTDKTFKNTNGIILSNTCDVDTSNERKFTPAIVYAPIVKLSCYLDGLKQANVYSKDHEESIRKQYISQIFFLPSGAGLTEDSIVFLDRVIHCDNTRINRENLKELRLFSLSQFGHYLFLLKLSIHFTRVKEGINRG